MKAITRAPQVQDYCCFSKQQARNQESAKEAVVCVLP
jgi:hypothetical protein